MNDKKNISEEQKTLPYILTPAFEEGRRVSILDILFILIDNIKILFFTPLIISILAIIYVLFFAEPIYMSSSTLLPSGNDDMMSEMKGLVSQFGFNIGSGSDETDFTSREMYIEILKSRTMANMLLAREFDTKRFGEKKTLLEILTHQYNPNHYGLDSLRELARIQLREDMIEVDASRTSPLITLRVESFEPKLAALINQAVIEELDSLQRKFKLKHISEKTLYIEQRTETVRDNLEDSEERLKDFRDQNRQIQNSPALLLEQDRLARDIQVQTGIFTTLRQQLEMAKIEAVQKESLIQTLDDPSIPLYPEFPRKTFFVISAGLFGIALGILLSFIANSLKSLDEQEKQKLHKFLRILHLKK